MMKRGLLKDHAGLLEGALHLSDWVLIALAGLAAQLVVFGFVKADQPYAILIVLGVLLAALLFPRFNVYRAWRGASLIDEGATITLAWGAVLAALAFANFLMQHDDSVSRYWVILWASLAWALLLISRLALRSVLRAMRRRGFNLRHIVLVGETARTEVVAARLAAQPSTGLSVSAAFVPDFASGHHSDPAGTPSRHSVDRLLEFIESNPVDQVWITLPLREEFQIQRVLESLQRTTVDIRFVPDFFGWRLMNHAFSEIAGLSVMDLSVTPLHGVSRILKEFEDRVLAALALVALSPILVAIAGGVLVTSPGPVLFKQRRLGWDQRIIRVYKFRTMKPHVEPNGHLTPACVDDPRVTPFGRFLRRYSLDELPQLYNVLQGRMSLVGPRPFALEHDANYRERVENYMRRHLVKPGMTGWAQVHGLRGEIRSADELEQRIAHDLYYVENWSLWLDLRILAMTAIKMFSDPKAY